VTNDHVTLLFPFCVVLWLCCDVLRLILSLNWVLFCIINFHIERNRVMLCFGVCWAPSSDRAQYKKPLLLLLRNLPSAFKAPCGLGGGVE